MISMIARFPGILASSFIGARIQERSYLPVIVVSTVVCVIFIIGILNKGAIIHELNHLLHSELPPPKD